MQLERHHKPTFFDKYFIPIVGALVLGIIGFAITYTFSYNNSWALSIIIGIGAAILGYFLIWGAKCVWKKHLKVPFEKWLDIVFSNRQ